MHGKCMNMFFLCFRLSEPVSFLVFLFWWTPFQPAQRICGSHPNAAHAEPWAQSTGSFDGTLLGWVLWQSASLMRKSAQHPGSKQNEPGKQFAFWVFMADKPFWESLLELWLTVWFYILAKFEAFHNGTSLDATIDMFRHDGLSTRDFQDNSFAMLQSCQEMFDLRLTNRFAACAWCLLAIGCWCSLVCDTMAAKVWNSFQRYSGETSTHS